jgi:hypothetical protein
VTRHNKKLKRNHWHTSAIEGNFFLRGFNYLFVFRKNSFQDLKTSKHEDAGALSYYFRQVSKARPGEVVTPEVLAKAIETEKNELNHKLVRKEAKKSFKASKRTSTSENESKWRGASRRNPKSKGQRK